MIGSVLLFVVTFFIAVPTAGAATVEAFASIVPVQIFVQRVGGARVDVEVMVRPGESPATYEPTPRQMAALADAGVFFRVGAPFERAWLDKIRETNPEMRIVDLRDAVSVALTRAHHHEEDKAHSDTGVPDSGDDNDADHRHSGPDPHIWTDPNRVVLMVRRIRDVLSDLDPAGAPEYAESFERFRDELQALDAELQQTFSELQQRRFLVYHPAWGYFAEAYDLKQVPIEIEGKEPGPQSLDRVIGRAREEGIRVVFVQPQFGRKSAELVAQAIDARVVTVDPLAPDYINNMRRVGRAFAEAMR